MTANAHKSRWRIVRVTIIVILTCSALAVLGIRILGLMTWQITLVPAAIGGGQIGAVALGDCLIVHNSTWLPVLEGQTPYEESTVGLPWVATFRREVSDGGAFTPFRAVPLLGSWEIRIHHFSVLAALLAAYPILAFIKGPVRRVRRRGKGLCPTCGYDLTLNASGVCPECGTPVDRVWQRIARLRALRKAASRTHQR